MAQALRTLSMTQDEFLDWAERQDERHEFDGMAPVAMVGSTLDHSRLAQNIWRTADRRLAGTGCEAFIQDGGVAIPSGAIRFPDVTITCSMAAGLDRIIPHPVVVFEVLSPSSPGIDRIVKLEEYRTVASIAAYVIVEQEAAALTVYGRQHGSVWAAKVLGFGDTLALDTPSLNIPVAEIYTRIEF